MLKKAFENLWNSVKKIDVFVNFFKLIITYQLTNYYFIHIKLQLVLVLMVSLHDRLTIKTRINCHLNF